MAQWELAGVIFFAFFIFFAADPLYYLFFDKTKPQTQEEWEDEQRERGNINDIEWDIIQRKREILK